MKTCCCCCTLKTGTVFSGVWGTIFAGLNLALFIFSVINLQVLKGYLGTGNIDTASILSTIFVYQNEYSIYSGLAVSGLWFLSCLVLFVGVCVKNRWCFIPWLVFTVLATLGLIAAGALVIYFGVIASLHLLWIFWVVVGIFLLIIVINIYAVVCVGYYFRELAMEKAVEKSRTMRMVEYNGENGQGGQGGHTAYAYSAGGYTHQPQQRPDVYKYQNRGQAIFSPYGTEFDDQGPYKKPPIGGYDNHGYQHRPSHYGGGYEYDYNRRY